MHTHTLINCQRGIGELWEDWRLLGGDTVILPLSNETAATHTPSR